MNVELGQDIPLDFRENDIFKFLYRDPNWRWHLFKSFLDETKFDCVL